MYYLVIFDGHSLTVLKDSAKLALSNKNKFMRYTVMFSVVKKRSVVEVLATDVSTKYDR